MVTDLLRDIPNVPAFSAHSVTGTLRKALAVLVVKLDAKPALLRPHTPWVIGRC